MIFDRVAELSFTGIDLAPVTDLRIQFQVEKHDAIQLNRAEITIFNLSENTRNTLARPHHLDRPMADPVITVILKAGYRGSEIVMFVGDVITAVNERTGPDWKTVLTLFTGYNVVSKSWTTESLGKKTGAKTIIDRLLAPLKLDAVYTDEANTALSGQSVSSFTSSGLSFRTVHDFVSRYGLSFTIEEDNQGLIYVNHRPRDPDASQTKQNTFNKDNGLLGTPKVTNVGVNIRSLLRPSIKLLQKFYVESETITTTLRGGGSNLKNEYHVLNVAHVGDTRGEDWFTEIQGTYTSILPAGYNPT